MNHNRLNVNMEQPMAGITPQRQAQNREAQARWRKKRRQFFEAAQAGFIPSGPKEIRQAIRHIKRYLRELEAALQAEEANQENIKN